MTSVSSITTRIVTILQKKARPFLHPIHRAASASFDLILPPACVFCNRDLDSIQRHVLLCEHCRELLIDQGHPACRHCGLWLPVSKTTPLSCPACLARSHRWPIREIAFLNSYRDHTRCAILRMKRKCFEPLVLAMGRELGQRCFQAEFPGNIEAVVPMPVHWHRKLLGSYDRCMPLSIQVAACLGLPMERALKCRRRAKKQGTLSLNQRQANVRGAFAIRSRYRYKRRRFLLVDDVLTTGATACEAARVLLQAGAESVDFAVVARAMPESPSMTRQLNHW